MFIKQKNADVYIVNVEGYENNLQNHPSVVNYPDLFEIVDGEIPQNFSRLIFQDSQE